MDGGRVSLDLLYQNYILVPFILHMIVELLNNIFFFYTTDSQKHNTKTKSLLNKRTTELYLIYGDQIGETKEVKKKKKKKKNPYICIHK